MEQIGVHMERRRPLPRTPLSLLHPGFTNCFRCHRCFPRAEGWGQVPLTKGTGLRLLPRVGIPLFYFLSLPSACLLLAPCSSAPLLHALHSPPTRGAGCTPRSTIARGPPPARATQ